MIYIIKEVAFKNSGDPFVISDISYMDSDFELDFDYDKPCDYCGKGLNIGYIYIINRLRKMNLLPDGFKMECCYCNNGE